MVAESELRQALHEAILKNITRAWRATAQRNMYGI